MEQQILGDYRILKQIGQGALGKVLLAEHRFIKKQFALKLLPEELSSDRGFVARFEEEVARLAALEHPHIVKIHNVAFAEGVYFLVTDCIVDSIGETTNLAQYMSGRKERFREEELIRLLFQVADALDYAYAKENIAHLNLKLNNILIGEGKPGIEINLSDFGLAKIIGTGPIVSRCFKTTAEALGIDFASDEKYLSAPIESHKLSKLSLSFLKRYVFLAPEQKRFAEVSRAVDVYSFGVLCYYLITGTFPEGSIELPSKEETGYINDWSYLIGQCMHLSPEKRPANLKPLLEQLTVQEKEPVAKTFVPPPLKVPPQEEIKPEPAPIPAPPLPTQPLPVQIKVEEPKPQPVLIQVAEEPNPQPVMMQVTEAKSVESATPLPMTPSRDDKFEKALSSMLNREPVVTQYQPEQKEKIHIEPLLTEMVAIQGGEYFRGSNGGSRDETPQHQVHIDGFAIDIHPVTNEQFMRFLEYMGGEKDQNYNDLIRLKDSRLNRTGGKLSIESGYGKHPVVGVTWYGAVAYAKWEGRRLPTEAEWEIATRGSSEALSFPTGDKIEKNQANFFGSDTTSVMSYASNGYGLYDMIGNVYEWCQDWYGYNYYDSSAQEPYNPKGPLQGVYRVLRGGCWKSLKEDMRCSHRHRNNPGTVNGTYGFRCAADLQ